MILLDLRIGDGVQDDLTIRDELPLAFHSDGKPPWPERMAPTERPRELEVDDVRERSN